MRKINIVIKKILIRLFYFRSIKRQLKEENVSNLKIVEIESTTHFIKRKKDRNRLTLYFKGKYNDEFVFVKASKDDSFSREKNNSALLRDCKYFVSPIAFFIGKWNCIIFPFIENIHIDCALTYTNEQIKALLNELIDFLDYCYSNSICFIDLKPANICISNGHIVIVDCADARKVGKTIIAKEDCLTHYSYFRDGYYYNDDAKHLRNLLKAYCFKNVVLEEFEEFKKIESYIGRLEYRYIINK